MNASGESVSALLRKLDLTPADLIVIHDDLDLPTGKIRLRLGGSSGGHKGIDSIIARIGAQDFYRVRVGIGRPDTGEDAAKEDAVIAYVLADFTPEEKNYRYGYTSGWRGHRLPACRGPDRRHE